MRKNAATRTALCAVLCALGVALLWVGSISFILVFCCLGAAMVLLIPIQREFGTRTGVLAYAATAVLAMLLTPDKETAVLYVLIGYYPLVKLYIDRIPARAVRILLKALLIGADVAAAYALLIFLFGMRELAEEFKTVTVAVGVFTALLGVAAAALFDVFLARFRTVYEFRLRRRFFKD